MRVVRNIVQNSTIDSAAAFIGAIGLINEISKGCENIYEYLSQNSLKSGFASNQTEEEVLKSTVISNRADHKNVIFDTEDTNFCKGNIRFALDCIGFENVEDVFDSKALYEIHKVMCEHLNTNELSNKFRSAMFTIKSNDFYKYWGTWSYGTDSRKRCLIKDTIELKNKFTHEPYKDYLKDLIQKLVNKNLDEIIQEYSCPKEIPNWKKRLIKEPQLLDKYCQAHYFGIPEDEKCCFLFNCKKRPSCREECYEVS